ncbi:DNA mismatch repair endonuclease MutL [Thermithiobacillus tepidarius DSM 3134]|uniref:DNA mismatch repair endonuclease MutL n=1 Tax=Thermithiobacillus tepidarius TaxID=929 RepID=UPI0004134F6C|nr:DNA mismatch repair endonuclease MutL [Thermithiobacillus tepidarius]
MSASRIHLLPSQLINQIAAGEVVERPASVLKELLENSLDAGADQVEIWAEEGGLRLIRVRDNGHGIDPEDVPLCLARHATSKIRQADDLERISSYGFRGEALPAIASVSRLRLATRSEASLEGRQITAQGGDIAPAAPAAHPVGTTIEVADLFFNTPARRKFLKGERTEFFHLQEVVRSAALSRFDVAFRLQHGERVQLKFAAATDEAARHRRVAEILGAGFLEESLYLEHADLGLRLHGWVGLPTFNRANSGAQYFFVNGRPVRDKVVGHAVRQAFADVLFKGRHPAFVLCLELDPAAVDVNVHPTKHEVRFRDARLVHDFLFRTLHDALGDYRPVPAQGAAAAVAPPPVAAASTVSSGSVPVRAPASVQSSLALQEDSSSYWTTMVAPAMQEIPAAATAPAPDAPVHPLGHAVAQLHERFILAQNAAGVVLVDQHAAHERVIYEELKAALGTGQASQHLLIPVRVQLTPEQMALWEAHQALFAEAGFDCTPLGPTSLAVRSVPRLLQGRDLGALFEEMLADLREFGDSRQAQDLLNGLVANIACRAAVKTNHRLTLAEMDALLRQIESTPRAGQCNHGRPTYVQLSLEELDRLFLRGR